jgi:hypothetical protein
MHIVLWVDELIRSDRRIGKINSAALYLSAKCNGNCRRPDCFKVYARWARHTLTGVHTQARKAVAVDVFHPCDVGGDGFTSPLFTAGRYLGPPFWTRIPLAAMDGMASHMNKEEDSEQCSVSRKSGHRSFEKGVVLYFTRSKDFLTFRINSHTVPAN